MEERRGTHAWNARRSAILAETGSNYFSNVELFPIMRGTFLIYIGVATVGGTPLMTSFGTKRVGQDPIVATFSLTALF